MKGEALRYLALETKGQHPEQLQCLSGQCMQWKDQHWLFDLKPFLGYWHQRAGRSGQGLGQLWRRILQEELGGDNPFEPSWRAALAAHPWQALLLLEAMRQGRRFGLASQEGNGGQRLLARLPWSAWVQVAQDLAPLWKKAKRKGFHPPQFRRQVERFRLAMLRLGIERPLASGNLNQSAIAQRFGQAVALLWHWSLAPQPSALEFPWWETRFAEAQEVRRLCDEPVQSWPELAPWLLEDLDRLARMLAGRAELVVELLWQVELEGEEALSLKLNFRNPLDLKEEQGKQSTLLLRLHKALTQALSPEGKSPKRPRAPWITAWRLELSQSILLPDLVLDLFGQVQEEEAEQESLEKLENQLPQALRRYTLAPAWEPESSFSPWPGGEKSPFEPALLEAALLRPLFILPQPQPLEGEPQGRLEFMEETTARWWQQAQGEGRRTYYKWTDQEGKAIWIFADEDNNWFVQGTYD